jgi:hypothetical protein
MYMYYCLCALQSSMHLEAPLSTNHMLPCYCACHALQIPANRRILLMGHTVTGELCVDCSNRCRAVRHRVRGNTRTTVSKA